MQQALSPGPYLMGIDVGTSVCKSVVFTLSGQQVATAECPTPAQHPVPESSEVDMLQLWQAVCSTIRKVVGAGGVPAEEIRGIGVSSTVGGVWLLDREKQPFRRALLWNDGQAAPLLTAWEQEGRLEEIFRLSGNAIFPGMTLPGLRWLKDNEPETVARARYLLCGKDWVRFKLTGEIHSDETDLSQMPCDIRTRGYSEELFELCGIADLADLFPPVAASQDVVGGVTAETAADTGLWQGTPVVIGLADVQATVVGAGAARVRRGCSIVGTSCLNNVVLDGPSFEPSGIGFQFLLPNRLWLRSLANTSGTLNLEWFLNNFCDAERAEAARRGVSVYQVLEEEAASIPVGSQGVIFHPYLNTTGVAAPFRNVAARAQYFGLSTTHDRRHLLRATYEGLALSMRELYDLMATPIEEVVLCGGGARSPFWCQMFADCTGRRMLVPEGREFGAKGVALLAGVGVGLYPSLEEAMGSTLRLERAYEPREEANRQYGMVYELYRDIYLDMQDDWWHRSKLVESLGLGRPR